MLAMMRSAFSKISSQFFCGGGFIETTVGRGSFVSSKNKEFIQEEKQREIESHLQKAIELSKENGISLTKLIDLLKIFYEEEK